MKRAIFCMIFSASIFACEGFSFERMTKVPIRQEGKLKLVDVWGELPNTLNVNSYDIHNLRITSQLETQIDLTIQFLKDAKVISTVRSIIPKGKELVVGSNFAITYDRALELKSNSVEFTLSKGDKRICKKVVRIWSGD